MVETPAIELGDLQSRVQVESRHGCKVRDSVLGRSTAFAGLAIDPEASGSVEGDLPHPEGALLGIK